MSLPLRKPLLSLEITRKRILSDIITTYPAGFNRCQSSYLSVRYSSKDSSELGDRWKRGVPIEVIPMARIPVAAHIEKKLGGNAELRMAKSKMVG